MTPGRRVQRRRGDARGSRQIVREVFASFESGSIQQLIHQMGTRMLDRDPAIAEVHLEANNRTWDTIAERGDELGVYTDARPPYGCLGLTLKRDENLTTRSGTQKQIVSNSRSPDL